MNNNLILVSGKTATGKSVCLRNIPNQERWMYLNCENNKALPFKNNFKSFNITDPLQVYQAFDHMKANEADFDGIVIDTATYLMDMFESMYVLPAPDTRTAWGDYAQFWKRLMHDYVAKTDKKVAILAHTADVQNESELTSDVMVKVKGALMNQGIESYFSNVISTKKVPLTKLEAQGAKSDLLKITEEDELVGYKYCFQTRLTKDTTNERMRAPMGMWAVPETFIDNDLQMVFDRLANYYQ